MIGGMLIISALVAIILGITYNTYYIVHEGNVGIIYHFGSLSQTIYQPGLHFKFPIISSYIEVQITVQTDKIKDVVCGTSSGVSVTFDNIEVVNQLNVENVYNILKDYGSNYDKTLIYDKITHELNQFCSKHTLQEVYIDKFDILDEMLLDKLQQYLNQYGKGVTIRSVRISKPTIPESVAKRYEELVASQAKKQTVNAESETELAKIKAENAKQIAMLHSQQEQDLMAIEFEKIHKMQQLNATIEINTKIFEKELSYEREMFEITKVKMNKETFINKTYADNQLYHGLKQAEIQHAMHTDSYVKIKMSEQLYNNAKIYGGFGMENLFGWIDNYLKK